MQIHLDPGGAPIFVQIAQQVRYLVTAGRLRAGDELPPIRALAERLVINPNTVARAYQNLERAGVVVKNGTVGTFVAAGVRPAPAEALAELAEGADGLLARARPLGIGVDEVCELIRDRHRAGAPPGGDK